MLEQRLHPVAAPTQVVRLSPVPIVIGTLVIVCAVLFATLSIARHYAFNTAAYDLAMYDQAVWNTSQGRWFAINLLEDTMPGLTNKLGDHVEPILLPIALLYRLRSSADVLLVVQAVALAALIWPLFHLTRFLTGSLLLASVAVIMYLAHPAMWNALLIDFHPVTLSAAFLLLSLWMLVRGKRAACLIFALLAMAGKEHVGLMVALLGLYAMLFHKSQRRLGAVLLVVGLIGSAIAFGAVIPAFQPAGASYYLNRYGNLGSSAIEVLISPIAKPDVVWSILTRPNRISYYGDLLLPLGGLPLLGLPLLLPALPDIALNTFSAFAPARTLDAHYAVVFAPFLILAAVWGIDRLSRGLVRVFSPRRREGAKPLNLGVLVNVLTRRRTILILACVWLIASMAAYHLHRYQSFLPLSTRYASSYRQEPRHSTGLRIAAQIPAEAVVSAQFTLVPHVSQRPRAHISRASTTPSTCSSTRME